MGKKLLIYNAPSGELAIKFNTREFFNSFMQTIIPKFMSKELVNDDEPQFKNNPNGIVPMQYLGEENTLFFPTYIAKNKELAINVVDESLRDTLLNTILAGVNDKDFSNIKGLFRTFPNRNTAIYFNSNHAICSKDSICELSFDSNNGKLIGCTVIDNKDNQSSLACNKENSFNFQYTSFVMLCCPQRKVY